MHIEASAPAIAVIGMGCWYPGARELRQLWENILARRQQFRRSPEQRLPLSEYYDPDSTLLDKTYGTRMAVIDGFEFDWASKRIPKTVVESADIAHWVALEVALKAVENAGYTRESVPNQRTGVLLGNSLTGEQTRSNNMRLRWPFVQRALHAAAEAKGLPWQTVAELAATMEEYYKSVFAPFTEDTLSGNLSNTIAGRICNFFDFHGGGYTVDGACSSSLIAVATAATALNNGDLDLALAGGVDISMDTFELVGFAKTGALTSQDMMVYDKKASGFIPGEGSGFVVLKRLEDARNDKNYVYAVLKGWGISSDGKGSLTAPSREGQATALHRAYDRAGYRLRDVAFIEGHGTGTSVGDRTELEAMALAMGSDSEAAERFCGVTSFKSLVGHTKAASGVGGFIKAVMAVNRRVIPPIAGCKEPNEVFENSARCLYPVLQGEVRSETELLRAGVSAMGFGGINCHVTIESGDAPATQLEPPIKEQALLVSDQETEVFVFSAVTVPALLQRLVTVMPMVEGLSLCELIDLAAYLALELKPQLPVRAAILASSPQELFERLSLLEKLLREPPSKGEAIAIPTKGVWVGNTVQQSRVGFLFPGQGSQQLNMTRTLIERYGWARELVYQADGWLREVGSQGVSEFIYRPLDRATNLKQVEEWSRTLARTEVAQPAICLASLLWMRYLNCLGVKPVVVGGHSLGELTAVQVAGAFDEKTLLCLAAVRGRAMSAGNSMGSMASIACSRDRAYELLKQVSGYAVLANINSPRQVVVSGERMSVEEVIKLAADQGFETRRLPVSNGFHSQLVSAAAEHLRTYEMCPETLKKTSVPLFSSVDGRELTPELRLRDHFANQVLAPVDFVTLIKKLAQTCDLLVEVGPGKVISGLVGDITGPDGPQCLPVESKPRFDRDLNAILATIFVRGSEINWEALYEGRLVRPFVPASERIFIENPCERPFQVSTANTASPSLGNSENLLNLMLAEQNDIPPEVLSDYLSQRGKFLAAVIRADLQTLPLVATPQNCAGEAQVRLSSAPTSAAPKPMGNYGVLAGGDKSDAIQVLMVELIVQQTGYAKESITMEMRLLDDLNLDSIKAGELVAAAAKQCGVAGKIDPSSLANAMIQEIAEAIRYVMPYSSASIIDGESSPVLTMASGSQTSAVASQDLPKDEENIKLLTVRPDLNRKQLVRDYIIQTIPEESPSVPLGRHFEENWETANVLILSEPSNVGIAAALCNALHKRAALVKTVSFTEAREQALTDSIDFTHFIAVLPCVPNGELSPSVRVPSIIERLRSVATPPLAERADRKHTTVAYVQFGGGHFGTHPPLADIEQCCAIGLAASLHLERTDLKVRVIDFSPTVNPTKLAECAISELSTPHVYTVVGYDTHLTRRVPLPKVQEPVEYQSRRITWSSNDVILVTGGGKGITAECALALARDTGVRMALIGRSPQPSGNIVNGSGEIARTLLRFSSEGLTCRYYMCDVSDFDSVVTLLQQIRQDLGEIAGVIHGAALNWPMLMEQVSIESAFDQVSPKLIGVMNLCHALQNTSLKLFVGFSSVISITGMQRNAWYGFSNEALELILRRFQAQNPQTAVISIAFSVWKEVGMGARMGSVRSLGKMGIEAIPKDEGIRRFLHLIKNDPGDLRVVVAAPMQTLSAFESNGFDTWYPERFSPPAGSKFLEQILLYEPGVEVVSRAHLSLDRDFYLWDHLYKGSYLFPTVFGLEAMAQAVAYVTGQHTFSALRIEDVCLERSIVIEPDKGLDIEIHAEVIEREFKNSVQRVFGVIRSEQTGFAINHFSATFILGVENSPPMESVELPEAPLDIQPQVDLYGWLLFQGSSFQRLQRIYTLNSQKCVFQTQSSLSTPERKEGFLNRAEGPFLLGDPFCRDSLLQAGQLLSPQDICLPIHIGCIEIYQPNNDFADSYIGVTTSQGREGQKYNSTVFALAQDGRVVERLNGYQLRILEHREENPTAEVLADPGEMDEGILRRELSNRAQLFRVTAPEISLAYLPGLHALSMAERHQRELPVFRRAISQLLKNDVILSIEIRWIESGKPVVDGLAGEEVEVSLSHDERVCLCAAGRGSLGCDIEPVTPRTLQDWIALLGDFRRELLMQQLLDSSSVDRAGTRIWTAVEALRKATNAKDINLAIERIEGNSVLFCDLTSSSQIKVLTFPVKLTRSPERMIALVVQDINKP